MVVTRGKHSFLLCRKKRRKNEICCPFLFIYYRIEHSKHMCVEWKKDDSGNSSNNRDDGDSILNKQFIAFFYCEGGYSNGFIVGSLFSHILFIIINNITHLPFLRNNSLYMLSIIT